MKHITPYPPMKMWTDYRELLLDALDEMVAAEVTAITVRQLAEWTGRQPTYHMRRFVACACQCGLLQKIMSVHNPIGWTYLISLPTPVSDQHELPF